MIKYLKRKASFSRRSSRKQKKEGGEAVEEEEKISEADQEEAVRHESQSEDPEEGGSLRSVSLTDEPHYVTVPLTGQAIAVPESDVIDLDAESASESETTTSGDVTPTSDSDMKMSAFRHIVIHDQDQASRSRDVVRRRTAMPGTSHYTSRSLDYDDPGTMSDIELSSFQRGGYARASMPIVRSASTSLERPIGLVFLVYRDETKKALLPNEITSLDTVRALFVRAFPEKLSMEFLDSPKRKIYILEATTSIFFQLEDLKDIKDRTVLKIHECDSDEPQHVKCPIEIRGRTAQPVRPPAMQGFLRDSGPHFPDEVAKAQSLPVSSSHTNYQEQLHKERIQWEMEQKYLHEQLQRRSRSRSLTPEPAERPRSLSTGPPRGRYSHSPDCLPTPERGQAPLNPIPENPRLLANGFRQSAAASNGGSQHYDAMGGHPHGGHHPAPMAQPPIHQAAPPVHAGRVLSPPPPAVSDSTGVYPPGSYNSPHPHLQAFVSHSTRAPVAQGPLRATGPTQPPVHDMRGHNQGGPPSRQSLPFAANPVYDNFPARSQPYRVTPERDVLPPRPHSATPHEVGRMDRMEAQIASLAAWVHQVRASPPVEGPPPSAARRNSNRSTSSGHSEGTDTYPASTASKKNGDSSFSTLPGLSDIPTSCCEGQPPMVTADMREKINDMHCRMQELRVELQGLRRMEQLNQETMKDAFSDTLAKLKKVIGAVPGAGDQVVRQQRLEVNFMVEAYKQDKARVEKELSDLELSVEELKQDVLARRCRINITDVESLALVLSNITKALADLKGRFPKIHESLRKVMAGEIEIVVKEEKFVKEEPQQIEAALKRCKKLTSTLYTLKRLATVQDTRPLQVPSLALDSKEVGEDEKMAILESIRAMVPDHDTRLHSMEAADASRERKKKIVTQQESLKFTKSLQTASKSLKPPEPETTTTTQPKDGSGCSETQTCRKSSQSSDSRKSEAPVIPAKPARLMLLTSEPKHTEATSACSSSSPLTPPLTHTVTVTSQISGDKDRKDMENKSSGCGSSARSVFFSSVESSPTLMSASIEKSPVVTVSAATSLATCSVMKPVAASHYQATWSTKSSALSSGPHHQASRAEDREEGMNDRGKRVPPPPPPRKSSARYPYGIGPLSPGSGAEHSASLQHQHSGERSPDTAKGQTVHKAHSPTSPTMSGPLSSTPKPPTPQKPPHLTQLMRAGSSAGVTGGRPHLQHQRAGRGAMFTTFIPPVPAQVVTNSQDPLDEGDLSESESTGSTTSLDSQKGAASLVRAHSTPHGRGPRPFPPQRWSSLKEGGPGLQQRGGVRAHTVEVKKPLVVGAMTVQVNGLGGAGGHKT